MQAAPAQVNEVMQESSMSFGSWAEATEEGGDDVELELEERTSRRTYACFHGAQILFLAIHGSLVFTVSSVLEDPAKANWFLLFLPLWIGEPLCGLMLIAAVFVSCPYINFCRAERQPRLGGSPSILTEILPQIVLSALSFLYLIIVFFGEYTLCRYLNSMARGDPAGLVVTVTLLSISGIIALAFGALCKAGSGVLVAMGGGGIACLIAFVAESSGGGKSGQAFVVAPAVVAFAGLTISALRRLRRYRKVLVREERLLRVAEVILLFLLTVSAGFLTFAVGENQLLQGASAGKSVGVLLIVLSLVEARLRFLEVRHRALDERLFMACSEGCLSTPDPYRNASSTDSLASRSRSAASVPLAQTSSAGVSSSTLVSSTALSTAMEMPGLG
eukprot:TRINITY_DN15093_c0_g1_i1.p1 TRINITY_DN15093_c0_g1~~TRINITY_DN15093_c0_g1_i1.p1  ORF type:complete len:389 (+),score=65.82 TRINITY_DN15093_c0_g1_i1:44-1210(+)